MQPPLQTAVIAAAGAGTRMWPATKVVPKELFPIGRVPAIVHLCWELQDAGVRRVVIVGNADNQPLLAALFDPAQAPPEKVRTEPEVRRFEALLAEVDVQVVVQHGPYGNGVPLLNAAEVTGDVPCIYAFGDDVVLGENPSRAMAAIYGRTGCPVLAAQPVPQERAGQFGIIETTPADGLARVTRLVEKPAPGETPSTLAAFGRYVVTPELLALLRRVERGKGGEYWFVDSVIARLAAGGEVFAHGLDRGEWITVGDVLGYARAVQRGVAGA